MVQMLKELLILVNNSRGGENEQPLISEYYKEVTPLGHLNQSGNCPLSSTTHTKASSTRPRYLSIREDNKGSKGSQQEIQNSFP
jgi:hypothetical protein